MTHPLYAPAKGACSEKFVIGQCLHDDKAAAMMFQLCFAKDWSTSTGAFCSLKSHEKFQEAFYWFLVSLSFCSEVPLSCMPLEF